MQNFCIMFYKKVVSLLDIRPFRQDRKHIIHIIIEKTKLNGTITLTREMITISKDILHILKLVFIFVLYDRKYCPDLK